MIRLLRSIALVSAIWLCACSSQNVSTKASTSLPLGDSVTAALGRPDYRLGPTDLVSVNVFQVPDLNRDVRVNNLGQISLPLIGTVDAAGNTVHELEALVAARYGARFVYDPQVSIFVKEYASQRVTVSGAVEKPGIYPLSSRLTLLQAVALAQGVTPRASERNAMVFRTVDGERKFARFDLEAIRKGISPDPEIMGEDVVMIDTSDGKVFLENMIKLSPLANVWRYIP